ncbi:MAG: sigma-54-dependent Fis family transcriptional regulator, partial [Planctomycetaceae bacterium]|nr:sigma-54-dependent Fis family transcriptional regulator [Planctomycetaceae bacterium]
MPKILVIDDDRSITHLVQRVLSDDEHQVVTASTADAGLELARDAEPDVVLLDIMLPKMSGLEVFQRIHAADRRVPVIFITSGAGSESAIEAIQLGAYDYVAKPLDVEELRRLVAQALETRRMMRVPVALAVQEEAAENGELIVGRSPRMLDVFKAIGRAASQDVTVLIRGESGTGKELVARALYHFSHRRDKPFM